MEILSILSIIISIITFIYKKIDEDTDYSSSNFQSFVVPDRIALTNDEFYNSMEVENLLECYATNKIVDFNFNKAIEKLQNNSANFKISNIIRKENIVYMKIEYSIPYNAPFKDFVTTFSMNYIQPNHNVIIYGTNPLSLNEKTVFQQIAYNLILEITK